MSGKTAITEIPGSLREYFWDYDPERLSWEESRPTIIKRLLQSGGMDAVLWLREQMSDEELRSFIVRRGGCGMGPRRLRFWGVVLDIPRNQVDEWVAAARSNPWNRRSR